MSLRASGLQGMLTTKYSSDLPSPCISGHVHLRKSTVCTGEGPPVVRLGSSPVRDMIPLMWLAHRSCNGCAVLSAAAFDDGDNGHLLAAVYLE